MNTPYTRLREWLQKRTLNGTSFTSFSDSHVISNLGRVGFKLGQTDELVKASSVKIKNLEIDRMVVLANQKNMQLKIE